MVIFTKSKLALGSLVVVSGLMLGCSGNPPAEQLNLTKLSVNSAVSAGATEYAPQDMQSAQSNLRKALVAVDEKNYEEAKALAEKSEWDARVAERKAQVEKAKLVDPKALIN